MLVRERSAKTILSKSKVFDYVINPYTGCAHGCSYCYARFMKKFSGHKEAWGSFVDVKINASDLLQKEIKKKKPGRVWISGVCDPYQPLEARYRLTRSCLRVVIENRWPITIQTRSALVSRDVDILKGAEKLELGLSITTADDDIRRLFEPRAPSIPDRIRVLEQIHQAGIRTYAMIAPLLPGAEKLPAALAGKVDYILVDRMNYGYGDWVYRKYRLDYARSDEFFARSSREIASACQERGIACRVFF
ncbi:MAG: radical SAM protein [Deltaproteobacteria bacterium]|nr:radical SAM protein [Deltaproteobacteria bacterium]